MYGPIGVMSPFWMSATKTGKSVPACVSSRHLRLSIQMRLSYQSSSCGFTSWSAAGRTLSSASTFAVHRRIIASECSQQRRKLFDGEPGLPEDRAKRSWRELAVERHDHDTAVGGFELDVASSLTHPLEARLVECAGDVRSRDDREARAHAAISTEAMIGGSPRSGAGASSK